MITRVTFNRILPLVLILLVLALGFSWHIFSHFRIETRQYQLNSKIHNAEAKTLLGYTVIVDLNQIAKIFSSYQLEGFHEDLWLSEILLLIDEIDLVLDVYSNGGMFRKRIPLNIPGMEEEVMEIFFQPSDGQNYDLDALVLRSQVQDLKETISLTKDIQRDQFSLLRKKMYSLVDRLEENANKISFDARSNLHGLHLERENLIKNTTQSTLFDALLIFFVISGLICLIFKQISRVRTELESSVSDLKIAESELSEKNEIVSTLNQSLEDKVEERTHQLQLEVDERERIQAQLVETRKFEAIGQLAGGIAHDFNNVLTVISGYGELLRKTVQHDQQATKDIGTIIAAAKKAEGLTRQLLAFGRKQVLLPAAIDLNFCLQDTEKLLKRLCRENIVFSCTAAEKGVNVIADASQLDQVLINLIVNARDAIGEKTGEIHISISESVLPEKLILQFPQEASKNYGLITVADNGPGIPQEIQDKMFDPFFTTKAQGQGTGLGLSTVYGIVKQSNGFISVSSEVGSGAKFLIFLPLTDKENSTCQEPMDVKRTRVTGKTIMIVDDEQGVLSIMELTLNAAGHNIMSAFSGQTAIKQYATYGEKIDLLITDVGMPGMNGVELAEKMIELQQDLPVLFISGYGEFHKNESAKLNDHQYFLQKPFETISLLDQIDAIFS